jgi:hypothetical protein
MKYFMSELKLGRGGWFSPHNTFHKGLLSSSKNRLSRIMSCLKLKSLITKQFFQPFLLPKFFNSVRESAWNVKRKLFHRQAFN